MNGYGKTFVRCVRQFVNTSLCVTVLCIANSTAPQRAMAQGLSVSNSTDLSTGLSTGSPTGSTVGKSNTNTPKPWPKVRSRRLTPPKTGAPPKIDVQIRPSAPGSPQSPAAPGAPQALGTTASADLQDWYWNAVPHDLFGAGPERFSAALAGLSHASAATLSKPTFQMVTDLANAYGRDLLMYSIGTDVSPALALAVISVESAGKTDAVSGAGAQGLMQLIPATAARFGVSDASDPAQNIRGGITYLDWLLKEFKGDVILALAGYNAGENAVKDNKGVPPYSETRAYVPKVLAAWQVARGLCVTPPDLYSDGCVFATQALRSAK